MTDYAELRAALEADAASRACGSDQSRTCTGGVMTNQQSINDILTAALQEVRKKHGLAVHTIRVEWTGTPDRPAIAITRIEVEGSVNDAHEQGQGGSDESRS